MNEAHVETAARPFAARRVGAGEGQAREPHPTAVLVGDAVAFSGPMLRALETEFPGALFMRLGELDVFALERLSPRLVLVHERLARAWPDLIRHLLAQRESRVAIAYQDRRSAIGIVRAVGGAPGASLSFLPMRVEIDVWLSIIRLMICGETFIPVELIDRTLSTQGWRLDEAQEDAPEEEAVAEPAHPPEASFMGHGEVPRGCEEAGLTRREREILALIAAGGRNKAIARRLGVSEHTVKQHAHNILAKLRAPNRTAAAHWWSARRRGDGLDVSHDGAT